MNYAQILTCDMANGPGMRVSLFVSGCTHHCRGCFNEVAWPFDYGEKFDRETENRLLEAVKPSYYQGMTLLGGEPFEPVNQKGLISFLRRYKEEYPDKDLWAFTGYIYDQDLVPGGRAFTDVTDEMLSYVDVLVDGPFMEDRKDITLLYKGSSNQRTIDMKQSRQEGKIIFWNPGDVSMSKMTHL